MPIDLLVETLGFPVRAFKPTVDAVKPPINGVKAALDCFKSTIDLLKPMIDLVKSTIDLLETTIDLVKSPVHFTPKLPDQVSEIEYRVHSRLERCESFFGGRHVPASLFGPARPDSTSSC